MTCSTTLSNTIFIRHPRPWFVDKSIPYNWCVIDARGHVIGRFDAANPSVKVSDLLVAAINADAPKPFQEGFYWYRNKNAVSSYPVYVDSQYGMNHMKTVGHIGKFIGNTFEE